MNSRALRLLSFHLTQAFFSLPSPNFLCCSERNYLYGPKSPLLYHHVSAALQHLTSRVTSPDSVDGLQRSSWSRFPLVSGSIFLHTLSFPPLPRPAPLLWVTFFERPSSFSAPLTCTTSSQNFSISNPFSFLWCSSDSLDPGHPGCSRSPLLWHSLSGVIGLFTPFRRGEKRTSPLVTFLDPARGDYLFPCPLGVCLSLD